MVRKQKAIEILEGLRGELKHLVEDQRASAVCPAFLKWQLDTETAIQTIFPSKQGHLKRFQRITFVYPYHEPRLILLTQQSTPRHDFLTGLDRADAILNSMTEEVRTYWNENGTSLNPQGAPLASKADPFAETPVEDPSVVFVVHGRNCALRDSMFTFLEAIRLHPLEWSEARAATKKASPYIGEILDCAFSMAQAVVVLMTPDDEACLKNEFRKPDDLPHETTLTGQARQNVLFEAGMAMGRHPERTVLVEVGTLRPFSDVVGRHTVRLDDSPEQRKELAQRLHTAKCPVNLEGERWLKVGSFKLDVKKIKSATPKRVSRKAASVDDAPKAPSANELESKTLEILGFFFAESKAFSGYAIANRFRLPKSVADYHIDVLFNKDFIFISGADFLGSGDDYPPTFSITPAGREFVIKHGQTA